MHDRAQRLAEENKTTQLADGQSEPPKSDNEPADGAELEEEHAPLKVLFLDIDGVLNCTRDALFIHLEEDKMQLLGEISVRTGCDIVLTTYWRKFRTYINHVFEGYNVGVPFIPEGYATGSIRHDVWRGRRDLEILDWIKEYDPDVYAIVDDRDIFRVTRKLGEVPDQGLADRFVRTDFRVGLTPARAERLIALLGEVPMPVEGEPHAPPVDATRSPRDSASSSSSGTPVPEPKTVSWVSRLPAPPPRVARWADPKASTSSSSGISSSSSGTPTPKKTPEAAPLQGAGTGAATTQSSTTLLDKPTNKGANPKTTEAGAKPSAKTDGTARKSDPAAPDKVDDDEILPASSLPSSAKE